jgi:NAD+ diphosphatase
MRFEPSMRPSASIRTEPGKSVDPVVFAYLGQELVVAETGNLVSLPRKSELEARGMTVGHSLVVGSLDGEDCLVATLDPSARERLLVSNEVASSAARFSLRGLRSMFGAVDEAVFAAAGLAAQLAHFDDTSRHCGKCGTPLVWKVDERGKHCPLCDRDVYPHVSPCAIVLVVDQARDAVLLTRGARFPKGMYGLVAGFVEPAESIEECAAREVLEETGIRIDSIDYAGSQPWPFPSQLMVGFVARYASGDIVVEPKELEDARWFTRDAMPILPPPVSIARRLIDRWLAKS